MGFLVPYNNDLIVQRDPDATYELDRYVWHYGQQGYLKRCVVRDSHQVLGAEFLEIRQFNFSDPALMPGSLCQVKTLPGRRPYVAALLEHPHALYLAQHQLAYNVPVAKYWQRSRTKEIPDLAIIFGSAAIGFFSPEEMDLS